MLRVLSSKAYVASFGFVLRKKNNINLLCDHVEHIFINRNICNYKTYNLIVIH